MLELIRMRRKLSKLRSRGSKSKGDFDGDDKISWAEAAAEIKHQESMDKSDIPASLSKSGTFQVGEWVNTGHEGMLATFVEVYGPIFTDFRGAMPNEKDYDPSVPDAHVPGYPKTSLLAPVRKLTLRCTGGYIKGYHFRIGYAVFIAFKAFIFPFIFGCTGEESSTNIYLTFALTLLEFFWLILWQPFEDGVKHSVAQLDVITQFLTCGAALASDDARENNAAILWTMIACAILGMFVVLGSNLDLLRDGWDVLVQFRAWLKDLRKVDRDDNEEEDVGGDDVEVVAA